MKSLIIPVQQEPVVFDLEENDGPGVEAMLACDLRRVTRDV